MSTVGAPPSAARSSPTASGLPPWVVSGSAVPPAATTRSHTQSAARTRSAGSPPPVEIEGMRSQSMSSSMRAAATERQTSEPMSSPSDGRFAPSPSGRLHIGNLRTALLAWLFARSGGGRFLLRIEDLDAARSRPEHERTQIDDLRAIGLDWNGEPLHQSARTERYREALEELRHAGRVYPCWCTRAEIRAAAEAPHGPLPEGAAYPGTCRRLSAAERAERERSGRPAALRLDAKAAQVEFEDRLHGTASGGGGDFVLWRGDDT